MFIATGVRLFREGLSDSLGRVEGFHVSGMRTVGPEAVTAVAELRPHVVLLDMSTPHSLSVARSLHRKASNAPVVALAVGESESELLAYAEAGIAGYLTSDSSLSELIAVVRSAAQGEVLCSPSLTGRIVQRLAALATDRLSDQSHAKLTSRERQIVALLQRELSNKEIAKHLGIEAATVKNHVHNLLEKLNVRRRADVLHLINRTTTGSNGFSAIPPAAGVRVASSDFRGVADSTDSRSKRQQRPVGKS